MHLPVKEEGAAVCNTQAQPLRAKHAYKEDRVSTSLRFEQHISAEYFADFTVAEKQVEVRSSGHVLPRAVPGNASSVLGRHT